jgi:hypothetical protein
VVRALVYQPGGPGFDSWHVLFRVSYYKWENPNDAAATYLIFVNYIYTKEDIILNVKIKIERIIPNVI